MIFFKAQKLQRLAELLQEIQRRQEAGGGEAHLVEEGLEEVAERIGVELEMVRLATPETLLGVLAPGREADPGKLWVVAELLYHDRRLALAAGASEAAADRKAKALLLYARVGSGVALPEGSTSPADRIRELEHPGP